MKSIIFIIAGLLFSVELSCASLPRNKETEHLFCALKTMTNNGYTMFGMANALTIGYKSGPLNNDITSSDVKETVGDNPAFVESDFMWYDNPEFMGWDMEAMRQAYARGAVLGYCWHLGGPESKSFYSKIKKKKSADFDLVYRILASDDRTVNKDLDWFLTQLDTLVIPVFKELSFPLIFRPFHEMTGDWFWWGNYVGAENYIKLYRLTIDYIRNAGVDNLLYCWSPDKEADFRFYPGDEYVDILGFDAYEPCLSPFIPEAKLIRELSKLIKYADEHDKIVAWTETGLRTLVTRRFAYPTIHPNFWTKYVWDVVKENPQTNRIAWIMSWYNADWRGNGKNPPYTPYSGMNIKGSEEAVKDFIKLYNYSNSLFESDLPDMYGKSSVEGVLITN